MHGADAIAIDQDMAGPWFVAGAIDNRGIGDKRFHIVLSDRGGLPKRKGGTQFAQQQFLRIFSRILERPFVLADWRVDQWFSMA
tara:strand:+ start:1414 stop:1665 length:252 start_codon:yes stop_codon:yes gene_type:complete